MERMREIYSVVNESFFHSSSTFLTNFWLSIIIVWFLMISTSGKFETSVKQLDLVEKTWKNVDVFGAFSIGTLVDKEYKILQVPRRLLADSVSRIQKQTRNREVPASFVYAEGIPSERILQEFPDSLSTRVVFLMFLSKLLSK